MRRSLRRIGLPLVGSCGLLLGCQQTHASRYPPDPLLLGKKPVESRPEPGPAAAVVRREPPAPESLIATLASAGPAVNAAMAPASLQREEGGR